MSLDQAISLCRPLASVKIDRLAFLAAGCRLVAMRFTPFRCRRCDSEGGYRSRSRNLLEKYLLLLLYLRPVRCKHCHGRSYRSVFKQVRQRS